MYEIKEERVRVGEWNEALCFFCDAHPRTEVALQKAGKNGWHTYYLTGKTSRSIKWCGYNQSMAETHARIIAQNILTSVNPYAQAKKY